MSATENGIDFKQYQFDKIMDKYRKYFTSETLKHNKLDSITARLLEVMRWYPKYFMPLLCYYYPFSREMLIKYQKCLRWDCLSENFFLDWDEDLLMEFRDKWCWISIGMSIIGVEGKLANLDFLLKYYEMGLISATDILCNRFLNNSDYTHDHAFSNIESFYEEFDEISQLVSRNETLKGEMQQLVIKWIKGFEEEQKILTDSPESKSKTPERIGSLVKSSYEQLKANQPKELEQIILFLEMNGKLLDISCSCRYLNLSRIPDPFMFDNPLTMVLTIPSIHRRKERSWMMP